jgi:hypothetical protein
MAFLTASSKNFAFSLSIKPSEHFKSTAEIPRMFLNCSIFRFLSKTAKNPHPVLNAIAFETGRLSAARTLVSRAKGFLPRVRACLWTHPLAEYHYIT